MKVLAFSVAIAALAIASGASAYECGCRAPVHHVRHVRLPVHHVRRVVVRTYVRTYVRPEVIYEQPVYEQPKVTYQQSPDCGCTTQPQTAYIYPQNYVEPVPVPPYDETPAWYYQGGEYFRYPPGHGRPGGPVYEGYWDSHGIYRDAETGRPREYRERR